MEDGLHQNISCRLVRHTPKQDAVKFILGVIIACCVVVLMFCLIDLLLLLRPAIKKISGMTVKTINLLEIITDLKDLLALEYI